MKLLRSIAAVLFFTLAAQLAAQAQAPIVNLTDPEGDDVGDGALIYPREPIAEAGDLDLRTLRVVPEGDGLRVEATFRNPVRDPAQVRSGLLGSEDLALFARRGFYAFNLDLYLDLDRAPGSGHTALLPGRRARVDAAHAWERAIVLTPRPELMRRQLRDALAETPGAPDGAALDAVIDQAVFFVRDARVRGRTVSFTVPARFVDAKGLADASLIAVVTAAKLTVESDLLAGFGRVGPAETPLARLPLGVAAPEAGRPAMAMGYRSDKAPTTAIVDVLAPNEASQRQQLARGVLMGQGGAAAPVSGVAKADEWLQRALAGTAAPSAQASAATAAAAPPPSPASPAPSTLPAAPTPARPVVPPVPAVPAVAAVPAGAAPRATTPVPAPAAVVPAAASSAPSSAAPAATARPAASAPVRARDAAFLEEQENRLRTLKRLRDANLITEEEFQRKRKEIIDAL